jgi:hypothetical protein
MAKLKIFISSTYYDLKHVRSNIEHFIEDMGYDAILSEKGTIAYNPKIPLDKSCYEEAALSDMFVLIIGGRYGSAISEQKVNLKDDFYERYESVTKKEFEAANKKEIPCYVLVEKSVYTEYETFKRNKNNTKIDYAHVDSINIFHFLDHIVKLPKNNPIHQFDKSQEIENWLKKQWAGLFRNLIAQKSQHEEIKSLASQVETLSNLNKTLKNYLEDIISKISKVDEDKDIIKEEQERINEFNLLKEFEKFELISDLKGYNVSPTEAFSLYKKSGTLKELTDGLETISGGAILGTDLLNYWKDDPNIMKEINVIRKLTNKPKVK